LEINEAIEITLNYFEFRYYYMVHLFEKLIDSYYNKNALKEVKYVSD